MRKTCGNMKKNKKKADSSLAEIGPRNQRDYSVYNESKPKQPAEDGKMGKINGRKTMVYFSENKYSEPSPHPPHQYHTNSLEIEKAKKREESKNLMKAFIDAVHHKR
jgi:hypothetical protein